ncbi:hypothetical protein IPC1175_26820 [Pseudomonas aeruginosa]|nr:hypothetical protein IPC1175_26820 [Pseudomonas aeruginosa]
MTGYQVKPLRLRRENILPAPRNAGVINVFNTLYQQSLMPGQVAKQNFDYKVRIAFPWALQASSLDQRRIALWAG